MSNGVDVKLPNDEWIQVLLSSFVQVRHHVLNVEGDLISISNNCFFFKIFLAFVLVDISINKGFAFLVLNLSPLKDFAFYHGQ